MIKQLPKRLRKLKMNILENRRNDSMIRSWRSRMKKPMRISYSKTKFTYLKKSCGSKN